MKRLQLNRQSINEPNFRELDRMVNDLETFLEENVTQEDEIWKDNLEEVLGFQDSRGSFSLLDSFEVESDVRVDYCYKPTYLCTAIVMKALMAGNYEEKCKDALTRALKVCCGRDLHGHGFESFDGEIEALNIFRIAGVREFVMYHEGTCPEFSEMIRRKKTDYHDKVANKAFKGPWGRDYEDKVRQIDAYLSGNAVFVYGTLLRCERNHHIIDDGSFIGTCQISGYDMYDIGPFPGIILGAGNVKGELYEVTDTTLLNLDRFEGEGSLYIRKCVPVHMDTGESFLASVYEYNHDIKGLEIIPEWLQPYTSNWKAKKNNYVWYVSYGSNMRYERFIKYIKGGKYRGGGRDIPPCKDTSDPVDKMNITIPFNMFFGNRSGSWDNLGVSFLDTSKPGFSLGVAYLVTEEQYRHIARQENGGKEPEDNPRWYNVKYPLGEMDGYTVMTLTNGQKREIVSPSDAYVDTLKEGLRENYPDMTEENIDNYLARCMDNR